MRKFGKPYHMGGGVYNVRYTKNGQEHNVRVKAKSMKEAKEKAYSKAK